MSQIILDELGSGSVFEQSFKIKRPINISHVRLRMYMQGTLQDGDYKLEIIDSGTVLAQTTINYTVFNSSKSQTYSVGLFRFDFDSLFLGVPEGALEKEYSWKISVLNASPDAISFLGIVRNWENPFYVVYGSGTTDNVQPAGFELFEYRSI